MPPALSVARAVMTCVPAESADVTNEPPSPIVPSRSELQTSAPVRLPSSGSLAEPVNWIAVFTGKLAPFAGAEIVTLGIPFGAAALTQAALPESLKLEPGTGRNCQS